MMRLHNRWLAILVSVAGVPVFLLYYIATTTVQVTDDSIGSNDFLSRLERVEELNIHLGEQLQLARRNAQQTQNCNSTLLPSCEVIHVAIVCAGYNAARDVSTVLKSIVFHRKHPIHLHLIVDEISSSILSTLLISWSIPSLQYSTYFTGNIESDVSWIPNQHYSGLYGLMKLQMPYVLPKDLHQVIILDTDVTLNADLSELWLLFKQFTKDQYIGLVENLSDWYLPSSGVGAWPAMGRGFNTGVMLMDLNRMRRLDWSSLWRSVAKRYLPEMNFTKLADQDIINSVIRDNPMIVHILPCSWNIQISERASFEDICYSTEYAKAAHFNSPSKYQVDYGSPTKNIMSDFYKNLYFMFLKYDGNLLKHKLANSCRNNQNSSNQMPTIGDLLDKDPKISEACYKLEGLRQSSRGRLHLYYIPYEYSTEPGDVTLVAHFSVDRLQVLELLCEQWEGPMSLALYLNDNEAQQFHDYVTNSDIISQRKNIGYHVVFKTGVHYPVNYMRNTALKQAKSDYVFLTDIDFLPMKGLYEYLKLSAAKQSIKENKLALVVPAFETQQYKFEFPAGKEDLLAYLDSGLIHTFRYDVWPEGHAPTDYDKWRNATLPYQVSWQQNYEPYVCVSRDIVPLYDERFFGFGWNKVSHIMELDAQGFKLMVLPNAYLIHAPHAPSLDISKFRSSPAYRKCLKTLKQEFQKDLSRSELSSDRFKGPGMGGLLAKLATPFGSLPPARVLMFGFDGAEGKTAVLYRLKLNKQITTIHTTGFNVETIQLREGLIFTMWDVSLHPRMRPLLRHYFEGTQALVYVIDSCDRATFNESSEELHRVLESDELNRVPLIILANKQDRPEAASVSEVAEAFQLNKIHDRKVHMQGTIATTGEGLYEAMEKMGHLIRDFQKLK